MAGKKNNSKIGGIKSTKRMSEIDSTQSVSEIDEVKKTSSVKAVGKVKNSTLNHTRRTLNIEEREKIFKLIEEEADRLFPENSMSNDKKQAIKDAVKMAIDAGILDESDAS